jgi:membrane protein
LADRRGGRRRRLRALVRRVLDRLRRHDLFLLAAGLTFYAAIAVVPLLLIAVWVAGLVLGQDTVARLGAQLGGYLPDRMGLRDGLIGLVEVGARLGPGSLLAALLPATTYGEGLARVFDRLSGRDGARSPGLRGRLKSLGLLATLPLVVLLGLFGVAVLPGALGLGQGARLLGLYATFWLGWIGSSFVLAVVYRAYGERALGPRALCWGALATGSFLTGMSLGWVLFLRFETAIGRAYGGSMAVATGVLAVLYLFLVQLVVLAGYALTLELARAGAPDQADSRRAAASGRW